MNQKLKQIADHFGPASQLSKLAEESHELWEAAEAYHHALVIEDDPDEIERARAHLIEEMADVFIVAEQVLYQEKANDYLETMLDFKIQRTIDRIEEGYYGSTRV